jgi:hypothetical protein
MSPNIVVAGTAGSDGNQQRIRNIDSCHPFSFKYQPSPIQQIRNGHFEAIDVAPSFRTAAIGTPTHQA